MAEAAAADIPLKSGKLETVIRPAFGGQIASLRWDGRELLALGSPRGAGRIEPGDYLSGGLGGIDDCIPAIAAGTHPTTGAVVPDHGELWYRPVDGFERDREALVLRVAGEQLPFQLERRIVLEARSVRVDYLLQNTGGRELPLLWAAHPLLAPSPGMKVVLAAPVERADSISKGLELTARGLLRSAAGEFDPGDWNSLPVGAYAKLFGDWKGPVRVIHPDWGVTLTITLEAAWPAYAGLWLNRGGFPPRSPVHHLAVEPTFGDSDDLGVAMERTSCISLSPFESRNWSVVYRLSTSA